MKPTPGRILHYCIGGTTWVPLLVVSLQEDGSVAGQLFTSPADQLNVDGLPPKQRSKAIRLDKGRWWVAGVDEGDGFGCWRWPPKV